LGQVKTLLMSLTGVFFVIVCKKDGESQTQVMTPGLGQMSFNYF
jgi:hypothetical protein